MITTKLYTRMEDHSLNTVPFGISGRPDERKGFWVFEVHDGTDVVFYGPSFEQAYHKALRYAMIRHQLPKPIKQ